MINEQDILFYGGIDTDSEDRMVAVGDYRFAKYVRSGNATGQDAGALSTVKGNLIIPNTLPTGDNIVLGGCEWNERNSLIYFVWNSNDDHSIWLYDLTANTHTLIFSDPSLNFQLEYLIVKPFVIDGVLYWSYGYFDNFLGNATTEVYNFCPPRRLDIDTAIAGGYTSDFMQAMDVIKWPPRFAPTVQYNDISTNTQRLYGNLFQFAYRWIYENEQQSCFSPLSKLELPPSGYWMSGQNLLSPSLDNAVNVTVQTGSSVVKKIEIAYRKGNDSNYVIYETIDKEADGVADNTTYVSSFDNTIAGKVQSLNIRNFDLVPQVAKRQEVLPKNQLAYANIYEDYTSSSEFTVDYVATQIGELGYEQRASLPFVYFDNILGSHLVNFNFVPTEQGTVYGFNKGDILPFQLRVWNGTQYEAADTYSFIVTTETSIGQIVTNVAAFLTSNGFTVSIFGGGQSIQVANAICAEAAEAGFITISIPVTPLKSFKDNTTYEFGIKYEDRANREGTTTIFSAGMVDLPTYSRIGNAAAFPLPNSPFVIGMNLTVNSVPPDWATHYRVMMRRKNHNFGYYGIRTVGTVTDNPYRFRVSLENDYLVTFGVKPAHEIKVGDKVRFIRQAPRFESGNLYVPNFADDGTDFELTVHAVELGGGENGSDAILVETFDTNLYSSWVVNGNINGALIEISTPEIAPEEGIWYETEAAYPIINANTNQRKHGGYVIPLTVDSINVGNIVVEGDFSAYDDYYIYQYQDGTFLSSALITSVTYNSGTGLSTINYTGVILTATDFELHLDQNDTNSGAQTPIEGDVYLRARRRGTYINANGQRYIRNWELDPSYSDYFPSKVYSRGRIGFSDPNTKRKHLKATVVHSNNFIDESNLNRLNQFEFQNRVNLSEEFGSINGFILNGYTLMAIQDRKNTSIYIGENMVVDGQGNGNILSKDTVFGNFRQRDENFGTLHGESVVSVDGVVYYYDYLNAQFVAAIANGQQAVSKGQFKFNKWTTEKTNSILPTDRVLAFKDLSNNEIQWYFSSEDLTESVAFNFERKRWVSGYDDTIDTAVNIGQRLFVFFEGAMYEANVGNELDFFGNPATAQISFLTATPWQYIKQFNSIGLKTNAPWDLVSAKTPSNGSYAEMETNMPANLFKLREGFYWAAYKRDANSPNFASVEIAKVDGTPMRGVAITNVIEYSGTEKATIFAAKVTSQISPTRI